MKTKYKLFAIMPLFMMTGCYKEHKSVVKEVSENKVLVKDIATGNDKIFVFDSSFCKRNLTDMIPYVLPGDTATYHLDPNESDDWYYRRNVIKVWSENDVRFNSDSIYARKQRAEFNKVRQSMLSKSR